MDAPLPPTDPALTLAHVRPLVDRRRVVGRTLEVTFVCPVSGERVDARWTAPPGPPPPARPPRGLADEVRDQAARLVIRLLGTGSLGRTASGAVHRALAPGPNSPGLSVTEYERGVVAAFASVMHVFAWDAAGQRWLHADAAPDLLGPLDRQLHFHPLRSAYDRLLVARMLVEVASVDGPPGEEELGYLQDVLHPGAGSLAALRARPPLTPAELAEASPGGPRVSMLALVHVVARVDGHLDPVEVARIGDFAAGLGVDGTEHTRARGLAEAWLLDQALDRMTGWGGHDRHARAELDRLGRQLGIAPSRVDAAEARFLRRRRTS